jgi:hypothetical protein
MTRWEDLVKHFESWASNQPSPAANLDRIWEEQPKWRLDWDWLPTGLRPVPAKERDDAVHCSDFREHVGTAWLHGQHVELPAYTWPGRCRQGNLFLSRKMIRQRFVVQLQPRGDAQYAKCIRRHLIEHFRGRTNRLFDTTRGRASGKKAYMWPRSIKMACPSSTQAAPAAHWTAAAAVRRWGDDHAQRCRLLSSRKLHRGLAVAEHPTLLDVGECGAHEGMETDRLLRRRPPKRES